MRNKLFFTIICLIVFSNSSINYCQAQVLKPTIDIDLNYSDLHLNPSINYQIQGSQVKGYGREFIAAELGMFIGGAVAGGFFLVGFMVGWGGLDALGVGLMITGGIAGLATPAYAGYLLHKAGQKYNDNGSLGAAIAGTYTGTVLATGITLLSVDAFNSGALILPSLLIFPALGGVLAYNLLRKSKGVTGSSLVNFHGGKYSPGLPSLTVGINPFARNTVMGQVSLLNIKF